MQGKSTRTGLYKRYQCRKSFLRRMGTLFLSLHCCFKSLQVMYPIAGSQNHNQLHRTLGVTVKTA